MRLVPLASGSQGNSALVELGGTRILRTDAVETRSDILIALLQAITCAQVNHDNIQNAYVLNALFYTHDDAFKFFGGRRGLKYRLKGFFLGREEDITRTYLTIAGQHFKRCDITFQANQF